MCGGKNPLPLLNPKLNIKPTLYRKTTFCSELNFHVELQSLHYLWASPLENNWDVQKAIIGRCRTWELYLRLYANHTDNNRGLLRGDWWSSAAVCSHCQLVTLPWIYHTTAVFRNLRGQFVPAANGNHFGHFTFFNYYYIYSYSTNILHSTLHIIQLDQFLPSKSLLS